jgi:hypothetical protein
MASRQDIWVIAIIFAITVFNIVSDLIVYSVVPQEELYGDYTAASMVTEVLVSRVPICIALIIVVGADRALTRRALDKNAIPADFFGHIAFEGRPLLKRAFNVTSITAYLALCFLSSPWILALVGVYVSDVPLLSSIFLGRQPFPVGGSIASVHLGQHHGWDGFALITMAFLIGRLLSHPRKLANVKARSVVAGGSVYLATFGAIAWAEDFLNEQVLKRGIVTPIYDIVREIYDFLWLDLVLAVIAILAGIIFWSFERARVRAVASL